MEISPTLEDIYAPLNHYLVDWRVEFRVLKVENLVTYLKLVEIRVTNEN
jgi:hypothetical protein